MHGARCIVHRARCAVHRASFSEHFTMKERQKDPHNHFTLTLHAFFLTNDKELAQVDPGAFSIDFKQ